MKFLFWDIGGYIGRLFLAILAGGGIILVAAILFFILWDKADILKEEEENKGVKSSLPMFWRALAVITGVIGGIWGISAFIDLVRFFF